MLPVGVGMTRSSKSLMSSNEALAPRVQKPTFVPNSSPGAPSTVTEAEPDGPETEPMTRSVKNMLIVSVCQALLVVA